jgi:TonB family protein
LADLFALFALFLKLFPSWHCTCLFLLGIVSLPEEVEVRIGIQWGKKLFAGAAILVLAGTLVSGQQSEEGKRKAKTKTNPAYPELARRMNITGKVKIEVVISPDGHVKSTRAIGGHPILVQPCVDAVKEWRFDSAPEETTQIIEFNFSSQ